MIKSRILRNIKFDTSLFRFDTETGTVTLIGIFWPIFLETLFTQLLGTVNTAILSGFSENAVAAVGSANQLISMFTILFSVIAMGAATLTGNCLGAQRTRDAQKASFVAVSFCMIAGGCAGLFFCSMHRRVLAWMNLELSLLPDATVYYQIRSLFLLFPALTSVLNAVMRCYGITQPGVYSGILSNVVNLLGSLCVTHFFREAPHIVITGIAVSCVLGQLAGLICSGILFWYHHIKLYKPASVNESFMYVKKILQIGVPGGMSTVGYTISQTVTTSFVGLLGTTALSAKVYFSTITFYCCMFSVSLGNANSIIVGRLCGASRYNDATRLNQQLHYFTALINLAASLFVLLFRIPIVSLFTEQEEILSMAFVVFLIDIIVEQSRAVSQIYEYALRSTGDTFFSMVGILCSCWINGVSVAYFLAIPCGLGLAGVWIGFALDELMRALITWGRWKSKKWIKTNQAIKRLSYSKS